MNKFSQFLKQAVAITTSWMIAFTLVMLPFPTQSNISYAADDEASTTPTEECEKDATNDDGSAGVYKPGCEFNDALAKSDLTSANPEGFMGYVEQYIGALFALVAISINHKPVVESEKVNPNYSGSKITFPIITAGSVAYLAGDIAANVNFKKASKIEVDKNFAAKKDTDVEDEKLKDKFKKENQKQLDAYYTLAKIYDKQAKGLSTKVTMAGIAEAAFIAAEVVELTDLLQATSTATTSKTTAKAAVDAAKATHRGFLSGISSGCVSYSTAGNLYLEARDLREAENQFTASKSSLSLLQKNKKNLLKFTKLVNPLSFPTMLTPKPQTTIDVKTFQSEAKLNTIGTTRFKTQIGAQDASLTTMSASVCNIEILKVCTGPQYAACAAGYNAALQAAEASKKTIELTSKTVIMGHGTPNASSTDLNAPIDEASLKDSFTHKGGFDFSSVFKSFDNLKKNEMEIFYIKKIVNNFYHQYLWNEVEKKNIKDTSKKVKALLVASQMANHLTEESFARIYSKDFLDELKHLNEYSTTEDLLAYVDKLKFDLIKSAQAGGEVWGELLKLGGTAVGLYLVFGKVVKEHAISTPKARATTWGLMAAINGVIIAFDLKSLKQAKERGKIVLQEAQRFANSHGMKAETEIGEDETQNTNTNSENDPKSPLPSNEIACVAPNGNTFLPAACPAILPDNSLTIPRSVAATGVTGSLTDLTLGLISDTARAAASNGLVRDSSTASGKLAAISGKRNQLIAKRETLRKKFDKLDADHLERLSKDLKLKKKLKPMSLATINSSFKKSLTGASAAALSGGGSILATDDDKDKKEASGTTKEQPTVAAVPSFNLPKTNSNGADFDFGDDEMDSADGGTDVVKAKSTELAEFELNENDIIDNADTNIFNVISNRYLRSYPILLEEK